MAKARDMLDDVDNVGIMQGFLDEMEDEVEEEEGAEEENSAAEMLDRRPDSPEILMNNLRGDMRSIDARREELADLVGYQAAAETPDTVLAMLQPVLAQGAGIGALPQSGPMAQGPQPPMPPPPGGEMGVPPPGAPPLPPGGVMPPAGDTAALLAAAGPPPGGGMAPPGPMVGPDGQPIPPEGLPPIQMQEGGYVQRKPVDPRSMEALYQEGEALDLEEEDGSLDLEEEDGSLDLEEEDGSLGLEEEDKKTQGITLADFASLSPDVMALAAKRAQAVLSEEPRRIPTRAEAMQGLLPEYEKLVGQDPEAAKAGFYFDLARAGLNLAANVGPGGRPLTGSALSRFAGAFGSIPEAMQKRLGDIEKTKQQVRLLALEAGEKERSRLMDYNTKLAQESNDLVIKLMEARAKSDKLGAGGAFGGSQSGRVMNIFETLTPGFSAGLTSANEDRRFVLAVEDYLRPTPYTDPSSGETRILMPPLPQYVERALANRGFGISIDPDNPGIRKITSSDPALMDYLLEIGTTAPRQPPLPSSAEETAPPAAAVTTVPPSRAAETIVTTPAVTGQPTVMGGRAPPKTIETSTIDLPPPVTLADVVTGYGVGPAIRRGLAKVPVSAFGEAFGEDSALKSAGQTITADLRSKFTDASRILAAERKEIEAAIDGIPGLVGNPPEAFQRFVDLSLQLQRIRDDAFNIARDPVALRSALDSPRLQSLNIKTRQDYLLSAQKFQDMIDAIGYYPIQTEQQLQQRIEQCRSRPGEVCKLTLFNEKEGKWEFTKFTLPEQ